MFGALTVGSSTQGFDMWMKAPSARLYLITNITVLLMHNVNSIASVLIDIIVAGLKARIMKTKDAMNKSKQTA